MPDLRGGQKFSFLTLFDFYREVFLTRECAHAHERVIAIVGFSLGRSVRWMVGSVVNFRACAVNEFLIQLVRVRGRKLN